MNFVLPWVASTIDESQLGKPVTIRQSHIEVRLFQIIVHLQVDDGAQMMMKAHTSRYDIIGLISQAASCIMPL